MAKLALTKKERDALTWFELDDDTVGKVVKNSAISLMNFGKNREGKELKTVWFWSAILLLVGLTVDAGADKFTHTMSGFKHNGIDQGDWRITIEKTSGGVA